MSGEEQELKLPKSRLALRDGALLRYSEEGTLVANHQLGDVSRVTLMRKMDTVALVVGLVAGGGAVLCGMYIEIVWLRWLAVVPLALLVLFMVCVAFEPHLEVKCGDDTVCYKLLDSAEEIEGFVMTLKQELQHRNGPRAGEPPADAAGARRGSWQPPPPPRGD